MATISYHAGPCPITGSVATTVQIAAAIGTTQTATLGVQWGYPLQRNDTEDLTIYAIPDAWGFGGKVITSVQISNVLNSYNATTPILAASRKQSGQRFDYTTFDSYNFEFDPNIVLQHNYQGIYALIVDETSHHYREATYIPFTLRETTRAESLRHVLRTEFDLPYLKFHEMPFVNPYHFSNEELGLAIHPYLGAERAQVIVSFFDENNRYDSDLLMVRVRGTYEIASNDKFYETWTDREPIHRTYKYAPNAKGYVTVIAYVNGLATRPVKIELPG